MNSPIETLQSTVAPHSVTAFTKPLRDYLDRDGVTELCINQPGEIWLQAGGIWSRYDAQQVTFDFCQNLSRTVSNYSKQVLSRQKPILSATLPTGERMQIVVPPAVREGTISFTIRRPSEVSRTLDDYAREGAFDQVSEHVDDLHDHEVELKRLLKARDYAGFFTLAVERHLNIIVSGATGSGKTTFMKALLRQVPTSERLLSIENVDELKLYRTHPNAVALFYSAGGQGEADISQEQLLSSALRMKPDRIFLAELIRGDEALSFLESANTAHPGSITSIHANNAKQVVSRIVQLVRRSPAGAGLNREEIESLVYENVDVIVQWSVINNRRVITEVFYDPELRKKHIG